jgi:uncharacterized protein
MLFEWDERKRTANLAKHHIDFPDAAKIFDGPVFEKNDDRYSEERVVAVGLMEDIEIVVVVVNRGAKRRIISARRAHRNERQEYWNRIEGAGQRKN